MKKHLLLCMYVVVFLLPSCTFYSRIMKPTPLPVATNTNTPTKIGFYEKGDTVLCKMGDFFIEAQILGFYNLNAALIKIKNGQNCKVYTSQIKYSKSRSKKGLRLGQLVTFKHPEVFTSTLETGKVIGIAPFGTLVKVAGNEVEVSYENIVATHVPLR